MMKKLISGLLACLMILGMSGCTALFSETYYSEKKFLGNQSLDLDSDVQVVQNYAELRRLVFNLMNSHGESVDLLLSGYTGNVVSDIASVCNAVKTDSAYGAYCVDYVSYDLRQIVSYYEAQIKISYLYTQEELQILQTTNDMDSFGELMSRQIAQEEPKSIVKVNNAPSDEKTVEDFLVQTIRNYPMAISYEPKIQVKVFSGNSSQKIFEVAVQYDEDVDNKRRLNDMKACVEKATESFTDVLTERQVLLAAEYLGNQCMVSDYEGSTAYNALIEKTANSEGIACAYKALCDRLGVECLVVNGKAEKSEHFWNIVKVDDGYYHVDVSILSEVGGTLSLFQTDAEKQVNYWWDQSAYPDCEGDLDYSTVVLNQK